MFFSASRNPRGAHVLARTLCLVTVAVCFAVGCMDNTAPDDPTSPSGPAVDVSVTDSSTGTPVTGKTVTIDTTDDQGNQVATVTTDTGSLSVVLPSGTA